MKKLTANLVHKVSVVSYDGRVAVHLTCSGPIAGKPVDRVATNALVVHQKFQKSFAAPFVDFGGTWAWRVSVN